MILGEHDHYGHQLRRVFPYAYIGPPDEIRELVRGLIEPAPDYLMAGASSFAVVAIPVLTLYLSMTSVERLSPEIQARLVDLRDYDANRIDTAGWIKPDNS